MPKRLCREEEEEGEGRVLTGILGVLSLLPPSPNQNTTKPTFFENMDRIWTDKHHKTKGFSICGRLSFALFKCSIFSLCHVFFFFIFPFFIFPFSMFVVSFSPLFSFFIFSFCFAFFHYMLFLFSMSSPPPFPNLLVFFLLCFLDPVVFFFLSLRVPQIDFSRKKRIPNHTSVEPFLFRVSLSRFDRPPIQESSKNLYGDSKKTNRFAPGSSAQPQGLKKNISK